MISDQDEGMVPRSNNKNNKRCKTLRGLLHTCQLSFNWLDLTSQHRAWQKEKTPHGARPVTQTAQRKLQDTLQQPTAPKGKKSCFLQRERESCLLQRERESCLLQHKRKAASCRKKRKSCLLQQERKAASCSTREKLPPAAQEKSCHLQQERKAASCSKTEKLPHAAYPNEMKL